MALTGVAANVLYVFIDALRSLKENIVTTVLTSLTLAFALAIFFLFLGAFINLEHAVDDLGDRTRIVAYVRDGALDGGAREAGKVKNSLAALAGVRGVEYISKGRAMEDLRAALKGHEAILEGIDSNPLPASFEITLEDAYRDEAALQGVLKGIGAMEWVEDIEYSREWVEKFTAFLKFAEFAALMIGVFLAGATLFIISNTIRLTVYARSEEIEIMRLVGASSLFIRLPFFIEGVAQGLIGGILALGVLTATRALLVSRIPPYLGFLAASPASAHLLLVLLASTGMVMGVAGSLISMGRFLKV